MSSPLSIEEKFDQIVQIAPVNPTEAYELSTQLLFQYEKQNDSFQKALAQAATSFSGQFLGNYTEAFILANEALLIFELKEDLKYQAFVYNTLGFIYNYLNDLENRLKVNLKSLQIRKTIGDVDGYMRSLNNTGDTYSRLGDYLTAIDYFIACLEITPETNQRMLSVVTCNLGEAYFLINEIGKSTEFLNSSEKNAKEIDFQGILYTVCLYQAKIKIKEHGYSEAIAIIENVLRKVDLNNDIEDIAPLYEVLSYCYEKINKKEDALEKFKIFYSLQERIHSEKHASDVRRIQFSYEISQLQNQKEQLESLVLKRTVELEKALNELQLKDKTNEAILESAIDGVVLIDLDGKIEKVNRIFCEKFSFTLEQCGSSYIFDYIEFIDGRNFKNFIVSLKNEPEKITDKPYFLQSKDKNTALSFFRANFNQIKESDKNFGLIFLSDITFQLQIEEERKEELEAEKTINIFSQALFNENSVEGVLWSLTKNCIAHLGFYECIIYLVDAENNCLIQKAAHGPKNPSDRHISNPIQINIGEGIVGTVAHTGKYEKIADTSADPRYIVDDEVRLSEIAVPIYRNNEVIGVIDSEHPDANFFSDKHLRILTTVSQLVANRIDKLKEQEAKEKLQEALVVLNANLEQEILNKTKENTELARIVFEQEQKAIFGELTRSVAHELNTPMAIIKSGIEAITDQISEACNGFTSTELTQGDLLFVRKIVLKGNLPTHRFGFEEWRKIKEIEPIVEELFGGAHLLTDIAHWLLKTQLTSRLEIEEVAQLDSPLFTLKLLFNIQQIFGFSNSVVLSVDTVKKVVNEIKSIHNRDEAETISNIQIRDLINQIFENEWIVKNKINCKNEIEKNAFVFGQESKLKHMFTLLLQFILTHSIIKSENQIRIQKFTTENSETIKIDIPSESIDKILEKDVIYSSEHSTDPNEKLKLNLILTILQEHRAILKFNFRDEIFSTSIIFQRRII